MKTLLEKIELILWKLILKIEKKHGCKLGGQFMDLYKRNLLYRIITKIWARLCNITASFSS